MTGSIYAPLPAGSRLIRLVELLPGSWSDVVRCTLHESSLGADRSYKALSYAWKNDDAAGHVSIICNEQQLHVTSNLYLALRRLRHHESSVILWVDALCINQADDTERTHQVGMMRDIYENSCEVIIWLGESSNMDDLGELYLKTHETSQQTGNSLKNAPWIVWHGDGRDQSKVNSYVQAMTNLSKNTSIFFPTVNSWWDHLGAFCLVHQISQGVPVADMAFLIHRFWESAAVQTLWSIMKLPWWHRTWVVQETVVAQMSRIYYGNISAPWTMFSKAVVNYAQDRIFHDLGLDRTLGNLDFPLMCFSRTVIEIESTRIDWELLQPITLPPLLRKFRSREASDKRDKVFALLGLVKRWGYGTPTFPDYSLTAEQVFWGTTIEIIASTRSLSVLAGTLRGKSGTLQRKPSWVTDWSTPPLSNEFDRLSRLDLYDSACGLLGIVRLHGTLLLEAQGFLVDEVVSFGQKVSPDWASGLRTRILEWSHLQERRITSDYVFGGSGQSAFWRTICADTLYVGKSDQHAGTAHCNYRRAYESDAAAYLAWQSKSGNYYYPEPQEVNESKNSFHYAVESASGSRSFFMTRKGFMGTGPDSLRIGDHVYVLLGSPVPFLLRPESQPQPCHADKLRVLIPDPHGREQEATCNQLHSQCYSVVGDAYVHGIMDGEVVEMASGEPTSVYLV